MKTLIPIGPAAKRLAGRLAAALLPGCSIALLGPATSACAEDAIVDAAMADIDGDVRQDLVTLTRPGDRDAHDVGIAVYLRDRDLPILKRAVLLPARFWGTDSAGQQPEITILENRSIKIHTENMAFGRSHWERTYTLSWRGGRLLVAGFTYAFNDTIEHGQSGSCDLDLLTGQGIRNGRKLALSGQRIDLAEWDDSIGMSACGLDN